MRILLADDDRRLRKGLAQQLTVQGFEPLECGDGLDAVRVMTSGGAPRVALVDWMMPGLSGPDVCRAVKEACGDRPPYLILLTVRVRRDDIVAGLDAGADDYITKPFVFRELVARCHAGFRSAEATDRLDARVQDLLRRCTSESHCRATMCLCPACRRVRVGDRWMDAPSALARSLGCELPVHCCPDCAVDSPAHRP